MKAEDRAMIARLMALPEAERVELLEFLGVSARDAGEVEEMLDSLHASFILKRARPNQKPN